MNVLWLQSGGCGGCSMSLLCADTPDFAGMLRRAGVNLLWHPSLSLETGAELLQILDDCLAGHTALDVLCIEGALLRGPNGTGRFHVLAGTGAPMIDWVRRLAGVARHVAAVGSCAAWGGISASGPNPTDACGLQYEDDRPGGLLGADWRDRAGLPVINIAGCPTHPGWVIDTLMALVAGLIGANDLDPFARPRFYADQLVHHGCTRNEF
ncbi:MAG TPA: HupU protein, partial [Burkholderiaceae bacterium]|nr:HupU protein [Burkholderiaceae bacterium]